MNSQIEDLTGQILIAMPGMGDERFEHAVVYLCAHSSEGAMGLIVNKPTGNVGFAEMIKQLGIEGKAQHAPQVYYGGPVEHGRGFVLHSNDYVSEGSTLNVNSAFSMTGTVDVLEELAEGRGPKSAIVALGYAGWGPSQLESEIGVNGWLTADVTPELVFGLPDGQKWTAALETLGVDPLMLSATAGRA